jgi:dihydroflavonol-4-reductase
LWRRGYEVRALVRPGSNTLTIDDTGIQQAPGDILDPASVSRAMEGCQGVFHCAAAYTFWARDRRAVYRTNVDGTANVLEAARRVGVSRVVYTSTVSTIGLPPAGLGIEDTTLDPHHLVGAYKKSKYQAEQVALNLAAAGLPVVVVNPTAPVGPWDVKPTPTGRMVLDFLLGRIPAYLSTGMNLVDVEDVAVGHLHAMEKGRIGERYILGNRNLMLREVFALLSRLTGVPTPKVKLPRLAILPLAYANQWLADYVTHRPPRIPLEGVKMAKYVMHYDCSKALRELALPQTPVDVALEKAVRWFRDHRYV